MLKKRKGNQRFIVSFVSRAKPAKDIRVTFYDIHITPKSDETRQLRQGRGLSYDRLMFHPTDFILCSEIPWGFLSCSCFLLFGQFSWIFIYVVSHFVMGRGEYVDFICTWDSSFDGHASRVSCTRVSEQLTFTLYSRFAEAKKTCISKFWVSHRATWRRF